MSHSTQPTTSMLIEGTVNNKQEETIKYPYKVPSWEDKDAPQPLIAPKDFFGKDGELSHSPLKEVAALLQQTAAIGCLDYEGFSILQKDTKLTPTNPSKRAYDSEHILGYYKRTPNNPVLGMKQFPSSEVHDGPKTLYFHRLPSFEATESDAAHGDTKQVFLYTGNNNSSPNVQKGIFFRLSDLKDRLTADPTRRKGLYELDWLAAFMGHARLKASDFLRDLVYKPTVHTAFERFIPYLPNNNQNKTDLNLYLNSLKDALHDTLNKLKGSHFPIWGEDGKLKSAAESAEFLAQLLTPPNYGGYNFPLLIFERFCDLTITASIGLNAGWNVMARYWSQPMPEPITLTYYLPPPLQSRLFARRAARRKDEEVPLSGESSLSEEWMDIMRIAHKNVYDSEKAKTLVKRFVPAENCDFIVKADDPKLTNGTLVKIGIHPQGLFATYVPIGALTNMRAKGFMTQDDRRKFPLFLPQRLEAKIFFSGCRRIFHDKTFASSFSLVTPTSVQLARQTERWCSQVDLMKGTSASDLAADMKWADDSHAEWLHKLAHSFGPLGNSGLVDSAQTPSNLIFGTKEANTSMMRLEAHIKRMVKNYGTPVRVTAQPIYPVPAGTPNKPYQNPNVDAWYVMPAKHEEIDSSLLAPVLQYKWEFPNALNIYGALHAGKASTEIDLFSQYYPTRFDVYMDEEVEKQLIAKTAAESKAMLSTRYRRLHMALYDTSTFDLIV